jgi:hypothetical protein
MLLTLATLTEVKAGRVDVAFRRWNKPTVKAGGRLRTAIGQLAIDAVEVIDAAAISDDDARRAGFADAAAVRAELFRKRSSSRARTARPTETSQVYRVQFHLAGPDPRLALRETTLDADELAALLHRLSAMDQRSAVGPWTAATLQKIATWPGRRAPELAEMDAMDTTPWKARVRRLKELGLTESLTVGYRLSPRGEQVLAAISAQRG